MLKPAIVTDVPEGAIQLRSTEYDDAVPVPVSGIAAVLFVAELLAIVSCPVKEPVVEGSNCTLSVAVWPGFNVCGKAPALKVNPVPVTVAEFTVTAVFPNEVKVTD